MPDEKEAPVYTAERILDKRTHNGRIEFLLKWKGWASKYNTWEPEKHILDKLLIEDFNFRQKPRQKKSIRRISTANTNKDQPSTKSRASIITRRLRSSSSSKASPSPIPTNIDRKPATTVKPEDDLNHLNRAVAYGLRPIRTQKYILGQSRVSVSSNESDNDEEDQKAMIVEPCQPDESLRELFWQPDKFSTTITTSITEVTDNNGVTVLIRELKENPSTAISRAPRFLGYGNGGRGGHH